MGDDNRSAKLLQYSREREEQGENNAEINLREKLADENKKLWVVAAPPIFTRFSTFGVGVISQAFIGHIGPTEPAAYALVGTVVLRLANGLVVPDNPSERVAVLPTTRKIASKNKIVFGTGDYWHAPTLTANMGFVRAISQTGV
ncbi:protein DETOXIFICATION 22-like isoform X2 [Asparagus officinalis]|uniref:protein DETOXIFICATION 22-like isoform X2 n=1 Tax=Asparagus officinalis TaxID=4686 RepID=UPI00098E71F4|nr:protein DETOXIFICATION 22-like isoform X2 [Asparagus officinalis]